MESPQLIEPSIREVIDRLHSRLDHVRSAYVDEFKKILFRQADDALNHADPQTVVRHLNESIAKLEEWAKTKEKGCPIRASSKGE